MSAARISNSKEEATDERDPSLAQVMGVLFNVMFLDHLATDIEHLERLNQLLAMATSFSLALRDVKRCGR